jgi:hypothetical protein
LLTTLPMRTLRRSVRGACSTFWAVPVMMVSPH